MKKGKIITALLSNLFIILLIAASVCIYYYFPYYKAWYAEHTIRSQSPFFELVAKSAPYEFNQYIDKVKNNIIQGGNATNEIYYTSEFLHALLLKYGSKASDQSLYEYLKSDIQFDQQLIAIDPVLVLFHEFPIQMRGKIDIKKFNEMSIKNNMITAIENVITSGINASQPAPTHEDIAKAQAMFQDILANLSAKYGNTLVATTFKTPDDPTLDKKTAAEMMIELSQDILAKGETTVGMMLRASFSIGNNKH